MTDLADRLAAAAPIYSHWPQLSALLQEAAAALRAQSWISVEDRWPEIGQEVLVIGALERMTPTRELVVSQFKGFDGDEPYWTHIGFDRAPHVVTHWMPLPSAPMMVEDRR